jgi:hypothetical protein
MRDENCRGPADPKISGADCDQRVDAAQENGRDDELGEDAYFR